MDTKTRTRHEAIVKQLGLTAMQYGGEVTEADARLSPNGKKYYAHARVQFSAILNAATWVHAVQPAFTTAGFTLPDRVVNFNSRAVVEVRWSVDVA